MMNAKKAYQTAYRCLREIDDPLHARVEIKRQLPPGEMRRMSISFAAFSLRHKKAAFVGGYIPGQYLISHAGYFSGLKWLQYHEDRIAEEMKHD